MGRRSKTLLIVGGILLLATLAVLLLAVKLWVGIMPLAACGMLWAQIALFGGLMAAEAVAERLHRTFFRVACAVILPIYAAGAFIHSLVYLLVPLLGLTGFLVGHILLLALAAAVLAIVVSVSARLHKGESRTLNNMGRIENYVNQLETLALTPAGAGYAGELRAAAEALRYTDTTTPVAADTELEKCIAELGQLLGEVPAPEEAVRRNLTALDGLIATRKLQLRSAKRGSF